MSTVRMKQITAIVNSQDADQVTRELLRQSVLHFVKVKELHHNLSGKVENVVPGVSMEQAEDVRRRIETFLLMIGYVPGFNEDLDIGTYAPAESRESSKILYELGEAVNGLRDKQKSLEQEILKLEDIDRQVKNFESIKGGFSPNHGSTFLSIKTGTLPNAQIEHFSGLLKSLPSVHLILKADAAVSTLLLVTMKRDQERVAAISEQCGFSEITLPVEMSEVRDDVKSGVIDKIAGLKSEQEELTVQSRRIVEEKKEKLVELWRSMRMQELYGKVQSFYSKTSHTTLFSGWVPSRLQNSLDSGIRKTAEGRCYIEWADPREEDRGKIPVKFSNPKILMPFQKLVVNYAVPEYGTVDPTPIVAVAYLVMFGLMFGDVGQGFVIFLIGLIGS
ncbi:MAG: hypothetical protein E4H36_10755, partial [Spirochaetales bacterium]